MGVFGGQVLGTRIPQHHKGEMEGFDFPPSTGLGPNNPQGTPVGSRVPSLHI